VALTKKETVMECANRSDDSFKSYRSEGYAQIASHRDHCLLVRGVRYVRCSRGGITGS
jgi:hypothetical protein